MKNRDAAWIKGWLPSLGLALASCLGVAALAAAPAEGQAVTVLFSPALGHTDAYSRVAEAGGVVVTAGAVAGILVARSDAPGFPAQLRRAGAWLVLAAPDAAGCRGRTRP